MGFHNWIIERQQLLERIKELEAENAELKKRLGEVVMLEVQEPTAMQTLSLQEKVEQSVQGARGCVCQEVVQQGERKGWLSACMPKRVESSTM